MKKLSEEFEKLDNCKSGDICNLSGKYFCDMHTDIDIYITEGEVFPKCNQKNIPHKTSWNRIIKKYLI